MLSDTTCVVQSPSAELAMRRSIQGMLEELEGNLWEHMLTRVVDYGHTFSPEIEMAALHGNNAMLLHGEAVNIDMAITTQVCCSHFACACWHGFYSILDGPCM